MNRRFTEVELGSRKVGVLTSTTLRLDVAKDAQIVLHLPRPLKVPDQVER